MFYKKLSHYSTFVFFENFFRIEKFKINESDQKPKKQDFGEMAVVFSRWISIYEQNALIFEISVKNWVEWHMFYLKIMFVEIPLREGLRAKLLKKKELRGSTGAILTNITFK